MRSKSDAVAPGLVIDGAVENGGDGTYRVTNPARPSEVVLQAPAASPAQLDRAVPGPEGMQAFARSRGTITKLRDTGGGT